MMSKETITFDETYERYAAYITDSIFFRVHDAEITQDLAQDTWLKIWTHWPDMQPEHLKSWLYTIALNTVRDYGRHRKLAHFISIDDERQELHQRDELTAIEDSMTLAPLLAEMKPKNRESLLLQAQGYTHQEIATMLGVGLDGVKMRVSRGRAQIVELWMKEVA
jgi:RNA polymerase sigma-70 factor (ECF subfamily)